MAVQSPFRRIHGLTHRLSTGALILHADPSAPGAGAQADAARGPDRLSELPPFQQLSEEGRGAPGPPEYSTPCALGASSLKGPGKAAPVQNPACRHEVTAGRRCGAPRSLGSSWGLRCHPK